MMGVRALVLICLSTGALPASESAAWLRVPLGAKASAMAGAYSARPATAEGVWYNPAAAAQAGSIHATASHSIWLLDTALSDFVVLLPAGDAHGLGLFGRVAGAQDRYRDSLGVEGGTFGVQGTVLGGAWGSRFGRMRIGLGGKWVQQQIENFGSSQVMGDAGAMFDLWKRQAWLSAVASNLGPQDAAASTPPTILRAGLALLLNNGVQLQQELQWRPSREASSLTGIGWTVAMGRAHGSVRGGFDSGATGPGGLAGFSVGAGLAWDQVQFDYAWTSLGGLGSAQRLGLSWAPLSKPTVEADAKAKAKRSKKAR